MWKNLHQPTMILLGTQLSKLHFRVSYLQKKNQIDLPYPLMSHYILLKTCAWKAFGNQLGSNSLHGLHENEEEKLLLYIVIERAPEHDSSSALPSLQTAHERSGLLSTRRSGARYLSFSFGAKRNTFGHPSSRHLKVILLTKTLQKQLLTRSFSIRKDSRFTNIFMIPSLIKEMREKEFLLRQEKRKLVSESKDVVVYDGKVISRAEADGFRHFKRISASGSNAIPIASKMHKSVPLSSMSSTPPSTSPSNNMQKFVFEYEFFQVCLFEV